MVAKTFGVGRKGQILSLRNRLQQTPRHTSFPFSNRENETFFKFNARESLRCPQLTGPCPRNDPLPPEDANLCVACRHQCFTAVCFLRLEECLELLINTGRLPEAAFFARTYLPSQTSRVVTLWRESLGKVNQKAAQSLADPTEYENLFAGLKDAFKTEQFLRPQRRNPIPAASYPNVQVSKSGSHEPHKFLLWSDDHFGSFWDLFVVYSADELEQVPAVGHTKFEFSRCQDNAERRPVEEMAAAEAAGQFVYVSAEEGGDAEPAHPTSAAAPAKPSVTPKSPVVKEHVSCYQPRVLIANKSHWVSSSNILGNHTSLSSFL